MRKPERETERLLAGQIKMVIKTSQQGKASHGESYERRDGARVHSREKERTEQLSQGRRNTEGRIRPAELRG